LRFVAEGRPIPTELKGEEAAVREQASLEDVRTAALTTHADDEYARAGEEDPRILLTTSRNPSTRLTAFAKELKLVFPNTTRLNRGAQARACTWSRARRLVCTRGRSCVRSLRGMAAADTQHCHGAGACRASTRAASSRRPAGHL
jgi:hypothetical protein